LKISTTKKVVDTLNSELLLKDINSHLITTELEICRRSHHQ